MTEIDRLKMISDRASVIRPVGRVIGIRKSVVEVTGLQEFASLGAPVTIESGRDQHFGVVNSVDKYLVTVKLTAPHLIGLNSQVWLRHDPFIYPSANMFGRMIDASGRALDGKPLRRGPDRVSIRTNFEENAPEERIQVPIGNMEIDLFNPIFQGDCIKIVSSDPMSLAGLTSWLDRKSDYDALVVCRDLSFKEIKISPIQKNGNDNTISVCHDKFDFMYTLQSALAIASHFSKQGIRTALITPLRGSEDQLILYDTVRRKHPCLSVFMVDIPVRSEHPMYPCKLYLDQCITVSSNETYIDFFKDYHSGPSSAGMSDINEIREFFQFRSKLEGTIDKEDEKILQSTVDGFKPFLPENRKAYLEEIVKIAKLHQNSEEVEV